MRPFAWGVVATAAFAALLSPAGPARAAEERQDIDVLIVTGTGEVRVVPDVAIVSLGVETRHQRAGEAIQENNRLMSQVVQAIRKLDVPERSIRTAALSVSREFDPVPEGQRPNPVYVVRNIVTVRLQDVQRVGPVVDAATAAGANTVHGISFISEKDREARREALQEAVSDAQSKAETMAKALGVRLAGVQSVTESGGPIVFSQQGDADKTLAARAQTPVFAGENTIRASVVIRYRLAR